MKPWAAGSQDSLCRDDIILFIDGKKVTSVNQAQKLIKSAAFQFTIRVERKIRNRIFEENLNESVESTSPTFILGQGGLRKRKGSESESSSSSPTPSVSGKLFFGSTVIDKKRK